MTMKLTKANDTEKMDTDTERQVLEKQWDTREKREKKTTWCDCKLISR